MYVASTGISDAERWAFAEAYSKTRLRPLKDVPVLVLPHNLGATGVCSVDAVLKQRVGFRKLGLTMTIGDIIRLAASKLGYKGTISPAQICVNSIDALRTAVMGVLEDLIKKALKTAGIDCSQHQYNDWKDWLRSIATNISVSAGGEYGVSIEVDWAGVAMDFLTGLLCSVINAITAFAFQVADEVFSVVDKLREACASCIGGSNVSVRATTQALTEPKLPPGTKVTSPGSGGGSAGQAGFQIYNFGTPERTWWPLAVFSTVTAAGVWAVLKRRKR